MRVVKFSAYGLLFVGVAMIVLGIVIQFVIDEVVVQQAEDMLPMKNNDSALFQPWYDHGGYGSPSYNYYYVWNITNPKEYLAGSPPTLEKVGPFVYRQFLWKEDLEWHGDHRELVSFTYHSYNVYLPERSTTNWTRQDMVTIPNFVLQGLYTTLASALHGNELTPALAFVRDLQALHGESLLVTRTVEEALFGFEDPLIRDGIDRIIDFVKQFGVKIDPIPAFNQLQSIDTPQFYQKKSVQHTGTMDFKKTAEFVSWCGMSNLSDYWPDAPTLEGTDGWNFPPQPGDTLKLFVDSIPAVITISKAEKFDVSGIHTHKYYISEDIFRNDSTFGRTHFAHGPRGLLNLTSVQGAGIFLSPPHFQGGDPVLREWVNIPPPNAERDATWLAIEPITGSAVAANQLIQINLEMGPEMCYLAGGVAPDKKCNLSTAFVPMLIANNYVWVPPNEADQLKSQIYGTPQMARTIGWVMVGLSVGIFLWVFLLLRHVKAVEGSYFGFTQREVQMVNDERQSILQDDKSYLTELSAGNESRISRVSHVSAKRGV